MLNTCFSSRSLEFWHGPGRGCLFNQPLKKKLGHWVSSEIPWQTTLHTHHITLLLKELSTTGGNLVGEDSQTPALDFLWTSSYSSLPFADFALYSFGWGTHVNPWLFHFNVWQNSLQIKKKKKSMALQVLLVNNRAERSRGTLIHR